LQVTEALDSVVALPDLSIISTVYITTFPFSITLLSSGETCIVIGGPVCSRQYNSGRSFIPETANKNMLSTILLLYYYKVSSTAAEIND